MSDDLTELLIYAYPFFEIYKSSKKKKSKHNNTTKTNATKPSNIH